MMSASVEIAIGPKGTGISIDVVGIGKRVVAGTVNVYATEMESNNNFNFSMGGV